MSTSRRAAFRKLLLPGALVIVVIAGGYFGWRTLVLIGENTAVQATLAARESTLADAQHEITLLTEALGSMTGERDARAKELSAEKEKNDSFEEQIEDISSDVGKLDKLSKTDPELLKKYSKVYFLNEHYAPPKLTLLDQMYAYDENKEFYLSKDVLPFFTDMVKDAQEDGVDVWVVSAYRSFETQTDLKSAYSVTYGSGANAFSADQGYSEHQLGTTIDFTTKNLGGGLSGFQNTPAYAWLSDNAHKYGFTLSYPPNNAYYIFEPWHWRFVGTKLADDLHDDGKYFYDLDQRKLDEYLISIFD